MKPILKITFLVCCSAILAACATLSPSESSDRTQKKDAAGTSAQPVEIYTDDRITQSQSYATEAPPPTTTVMDTQGAELAAGMVKPAAANTPAAPQRTIAATRNAEDSSSLSLNMPYARVWAATKKALPQAGYPIMEQDSASGTYYILDKVGSGGVIQRDAPIYQLQLQKREDQTVVARLKNAHNQSAPADVTQRIFTVLKSTLSR
jgi:uncharacterized lipoprotein